MAVLASDNFPGADNIDLGPNWNVQSGGFDPFNRVSTAAQPASAGSDAAENYDGGISWPNDQYSQVRIVTLSGDATRTELGIGVACRMAAAAQTLYWAVTANAASGSNRTWLAKFVAGTYTLIGSSTTSFATNDILRIQAVGTTISVWKNGVSIISVTDSSIASGRPGLAHGSAPTSIGVVDDWEAGSVEASSAIACTVPVSALATTNNQATYALSAFTPTSQATLVAFVFATNTVASGLLSGAGLTWTRAASTRLSGTDTGYLFWANTGPSATASAITFDCTGDNATGAVMMVLQFTNTLLSNPVRQVLAQSGSTSGITGTFSFSLTSNNGYALGFGIARNPPAATPPTGWTEVSDVGYATPTAGAQVAYRATGQSGVTLSIVTSAGAWGLLGIEIAAALAVSNAAKGALYYQRRRRAS